MQVTVTRVKMIGGGNAYSVLVRESDVPRHARDAASYRTIRDGVTYVEYASATVTPEHAAMPQGWDKYTDWMAHESTAREEMMLIAMRAFPELQQVWETGKRKLPELWVTYPDFDRESEDRVVESELCARCGGPADHPDCLGRPHTCPNRVAYA